MEIWDINKLQRDKKQNQLYNLFDQTFKLAPVTGQFEQHIVEEDEEMRIDLICFRLYGNTDEISFLLNLNEISNPLNIRKGDIILYGSAGGLDQYKIEPQQENLVPEILANVDKSTRKDPNRDSFEKNNYTLPPNLQETPRPPFQVIGDTVIIGG